MVVKFGTSGLRGLVSDMSDAICADHVAAFLRHLAAVEPQVDTVLVGRDLRPSSPRIAAACVGAILGEGRRAVDCGVLPTPALALEAAARGAAAVMVTGSHIPFDRNGIKFYRASGEITKADEAGILAALGPARSGAGAVEDGAAAAVARYAARAAALAPPGTLAGWRVAVWQHSAAGRDILADILAATGATVIPLGRTDAFVPVDTEAVAAEDVARARIWAAAHGFHALVSTDGDGDRPLIADETGSFLRGDTVGMLTARHLGADAVATPVSSSTALERTGWFARVARTRIGSPHVIEGMEALAAQGARLAAGYEANGGFLLGGSATAPGGPLVALPTRDAAAPILAVLEMAAGQRVPLSALVAALPARSTASDRLTEVATERSGALLAALAADAGRRADLARAAGAAAVLGVDALDGVRLTLDGERIVHLRASGNAPELRCYAEAGDAATAAALVAAGLGWAERQFLKSANRHEAID